MEAYPTKGGGTDVPIPTTLPSEVSTMMSQVFATLDKFLPAYAALRSLQQPTDDQMKAIGIFKGIGMGLATKDFTAIAAYLPSRGEDKNLRVPVPENVVKARVYSKNGVKQFDVHACGDLTLDDRSDWVARVEFFDAQGVMIAATGSEAPRKSPRSAPYLS